MKQVLFLVFTALLLNFSICTHCYETCKFVASYFKRILNFPYILGMILVTIKIIFQTGSIDICDSSDMCALGLRLHTLNMHALGLRLHTFFQRAFSLCVLRVVFVPTNLYAIRMICTFLRIEIERF